MADQQYEEEYYEDYAPPSRRWLWVVTILAVVAAVVFAVLWHLRGGEIGRLDAAMQSAQSAADAAARRLQADLDQARTDLAAAATDHDRALAAAAGQTDDLRRQLAQATEREQAAVASLAAGAASREEVDALQARLDDALAAGTRAGGLAEELAQARAGAAELESAAAELRTSNAAISRELASANAEIRRAEAERQELADLRRRLAQRDEELDRTRAESAEHSRQRQALLSTQASQTTAAKGMEQTLRATITELEAKIRAAGAESAERARAAETAVAEGLRRDVERERGRADAAEKSLEEANAAAAEAAKAAGARLTAVNDRLAEAGRTIGRLEKQVSDLEANRERLGRELTTAGEEARTAVAAREGLAKALAEAEKRAGEREQALAEAERRAENALRARERELQDAFETQKSEWQEQLDALRRAMNEAKQSSRDPEPDSGSGEGGAPASLAQAAPPTAPAAMAAAVAVEAMPAPAAPAASVAPAGYPLEEPRHVVIGDPGRFVGQVVQVLADGLTVMISGGGRQRMKPGMIFDVHRCFSGMNRYVGLLRVTRVLDEYSLAVPAFPAREARVCPVTGRVVLDQSVRFSPYAEVEGGRPVPLISASSLGLGQDMPVVGDMIDNPYYHPGRSLVYAVAPGVEGDIRVEMLVGGLGGVVSRDPANADFSIVRAGDAGSLPHDRPRRVTVDGLANYVEPSASY